MTFPHITPKQFEILILIYRFRFLDRVQIQTLLHHKDYRRINEWLTNLVEKEHLGRNVFKGTSDKLLPAVYFLEKNGIAYLRKHYEDVYEVELEKRTREHEKSLNFQIHCQALGHIYLSYIDYADYLDNELTFTTQADFTSEEPTFLLYPDAHVILEDLEEETKTHYAIEIIDRNTPMFTLKHRIREYIEYFYDSEWQSSSEDPFPKCLFFCQTPSRKRALMRIIPRLKDEFDNPSMTFMLTTLETFAKEGLDGKLWNYIEPDDDNYDEEEAFENEEDW